jgi:hypothetical protein
MYFIPREYAFSMQLHFPKLDLKCLSLPPSVSNVFSSSPANFNPEAFKDILEEADVGVYYGWARLNDDSIEPMVMSIGNNPQYGNKEKSAEVHILKKYTEDFYGAKLAVVVVGFVRDMLKFTSLQQLIDAMNMDVSFSKEQLETQYAQTLKQDPFLTS